MVGTTSHDCPIIIDTVREIRGSKQINIGLEASVSPVDCPVFTRIGQQNTMYRFYHTDSCSLNCV